MGQVHSGIVTMTTASRQAIKHRQDSLSVLAKL